VAVESEAGDHYLLFVADNGVREYTIQRTKAAPRAEFGRTIRRVGAIRGRADPHFSGK
jgi:hypothetical protein